MCVRKIEAGRELVVIILEVFLIIVPLFYHKIFLGCLILCILHITWCCLSDAGKELNDPRVLTDVGDVPVQEIRDCGVDDDRLMKIISESVKLVMEEVRT